MFFSLTSRAQSQTPPAAPAAAAGDQLLRPEQLEALVAPIALYPDALLAEVLMAATYPLEVVQADRWAGDNKKLAGDQLKAVVDKQSWDDSIKALVATPSVLATMSTKLDWTQKLGDAVLAQQPDVMDAIQRLRVKAQANDKLKSTEQQKVTVVQQADRQVVTIEPTNPDTLYVPYYDPGVVYGAWPYADDPAYYFGYPSYIGAGIIATGLAFGAGYALGRWVAGGNRWGGGVNWGNRNIVATRPANINNIAAGNAWQHNPAHRQGVRYGNTNVQQRFGNNNARTGSQQRMDFRGRSGEQVLNPGNKGAGANRPGGGNAGANRPAGGGNAVANRAAGGGNKAANRASGRRLAPPGAAPPPKNRSAGGGARRDTAFGNVQSGRVTSMQSARGHRELRQCARVRSVPVGVVASGRPCWRRWRTRRWRRRYGAPTSPAACSTSCCSAISTTASASIASATTARTASTSA